MGGTYASSAVKAVFGKAVIVTVCLASPWTRATDLLTQDQALEHGYGFGVHAFFAGDYQRAHDDLDQVIQTGSRDPRAWYFRGLSALKLGRIDEAEADFERGADIEAAAAADWPVGRSLERIQGPQRIVLERHRVRARMVLLQKREEAYARRYQETMSAQDDQLRRVRPQSGRGDGTQNFGEEEGGKSGSGERESEEPGGDADGT